MARRLVYRSDGTNYVLYSAGPDGAASTNDDIYPVVDATVLEEPGAQTNLPAKPGA